MCVYVISRQKGSKVGKEETISSKAENHVFILSSFPFDNLSMLNGKCSYSQQSLEYQKTIAKTLLFFSLLIVFFSMS